MTKIEGSVFGSGVEARTTIRGTLPFYGFGRTQILREHTAVKISDFEETCEGVPGGGITPPGQSVYIELFVDAESDLLVDRPGRFEAWLPSQRGDRSPPDEPFAVVTYVDAPNGRGTVAQTGAVTIDVVTESELSGSFEVTFESGALSGAITAPTYCDRVPGSAIVP